MSGSSYSENDSEYEEYEKEEKEEEIPKRLIEKLFSRIIYPNDFTNSKETPETIQLISQISKKKHVYQIYFPEELQFDLYEIIFSSEFLRTSILSMFYLPFMKNMLFIESENDKFLDIFKDLLIKKIDPKIALLSYFCNVHIYSILTPLNSCFSRITIAPFKQVPCEIIDLNFIKKKALIRIFNPPKLSSAKNIETKKVYLDFNKTKYIKNGKIIKSQKFIGDFIVEKIKIFNLLTLSSNITDDEKEVFFRSPLSEININKKRESRFNRISYDQAMKFIRKLNENKSLFECFDQHVINEIGRIELSSILEVTQPFLTIESSELSNDQRVLETPVINHLIRLRSGEHGVIINYDIENIVVLLTTNEIINLPIGTDFLYIHSDNLARDVNNKRLYDQDFIKILEGEFSEQTVQIIRTIQKMIFCYVSSNKTADNQTKPYFIKSSNCQQIMDDEGPFVSSK